MKVLVANKFFFRKGGAEAVMFDEIAALRDKEIEVVEFSMQAQRNYPSTYAPYFVSEKSYRSGLRAARIMAAMSFVHSPEAVRNIRRLIRDQRPDILHCHNIYHQLTPSIIGAAAQLGIPVVLTLHDYKVVCPVYTRLRNGEPCTLCSDGQFENVLRHRCAGNSVVQSALMWAEARYHALAGTYRQVNKFIAPSRFMKDAVTARLGADRVVYIPNGIDVSAHERSHDDDNYVLFLGRVSPEKGLETLLRAHAASAAKWRLVVAGTGSLLGELKSLFPGAEFVGHLEGKALKSTLRAASIVVVPSEWHENAPISILEAMAYGKPVIASRIGGIPELVRHGFSGFLFEPKNVGELSRYIDLLLADADLRGRFSYEARRIIETEYSLERHTAALLSLYESLMPTRAGAVRDEALVIPEGRLPDRMSRSTV